MNFQQQLTEWLKAHPFIALEKVAAACHYPPKTFRPGRRTIHEDKWFDLCAALATYGLVLEGRKFRYGEDEKGSFLYVFTAPFTGDFIRKPDFPEWVKQNIETPEK